MERREPPDLLQVERVEEEEAPRPAKAATAMTVAPEKGMERKKRRSIRGSARRGSQRSSPTSDPRATAKAPMITPEDHPRLGASMIP
jgi:hypothetical protein